MIDIYAMHFYQNGSIQESKTLIQTIPATDEGQIYLVDPKVSEKIGDASSFDFSVQPDSPYFNAFIQMRTYLYVEYDGDLIFYGRVLTIENGFWGEQKIKCEGAQAFFNDSYYPGVDESKRENRYVQEYITNILENHNTQLEDPLRMIYPGEIPGQYSDSISEEQRIENSFRNFGESGWKQTKSTLDDLTSHYGGMFRVRYGVDGKLYLDWLKHYYRSTINGQSIEVGKNMIELSSITEVNNIFTVVLPIGDGPGNEKLYLDEMYFPVSRVTEFYSDSELESGYHHKSDYVNAESRYGKIIKPQEFNTATTQEDLRKECAKWVKENYQGGVESFTVSAIDLHQIGDNVQKIMCGDRVPIRYPIGHGQIDERTITCTSASYELYSPETNSYSFGIPASSLSKGYSVNSSKSTQDAESEIKPSYGGGGGELSPYEKWWKQTHKWLYNHKVWCKSVGLDPSTEKRGRGPLTDDYFIRATTGSVDGEPAWRVFKPQYTIKKVTIKDPLTQKDIIKSYYVWTKDAQGRPLADSRHWSIVAESKVNRDLLYANKIFEYVKDEWGWDLVNGGKYQMPAEDDLGLSSYLPSDVVDELGDLQSGIEPQRIITTVMDDLGNTVAHGMETFINNMGITIPEGLKVSLGTFKDSLGNTLNSAVTFLDDKFHFSSFLESTGEKFKEVLLNNQDGMILADGTIISKDIIQGVLGLLTGGNVDAGGNVNADGNVNGNDITFLDTNGVRQSTRDMKMEVVQTGSKFGSLVTRYFGDPDDPDNWKPVAYEFSQAIEEYEGGNLVVTKVEGDLVFLGNAMTDQLLEVARKEGQNIVGNFTYETDPATGKRNLVVKSGGGMRIRHDDGTGTTAEFGVYDENTLKGGIIVEKINDVGTVTKIKGDRVDIEAKQVRVGNTTNVENWMNSTDTWKNSTDETLDSYEGLIADRATIADLNAAKARISTIESDYITADNLSVNIANITTQLSSWDARFYRAKASDFIILGSDSQGHETNTSVKTFIKEIQISDPVNNVYTLQYKTYSDSDWQNAGTFSRATTLTGAWGSGDDADKFIVTASPQGKQYKYSPPLRLYGRTDQSNFSAEVYYADGSSIVPKKSVQGFLVLGGSGTNSYVEVNENSQGTGSGYARFQLGDFLENKGTITSNGTYTPSSGYIGISSIKVNVETSDIANAKARFNAASGSYYIEAYDNRYGTAIADSSVTYKLATSGSTSSTKVIITNAGGTQLSSTPELSVGSLYTDGSTAGKNAVTLNNPAWTNALPYTSGLSNTVTVSTNGRPTQLSKSIPVTISQGSWSNGAKTVDITTTNGSVVARDTVSAPSVTVSAGTWSNGAVTVTAKHGTKELGSTTVNAPSVTVSAGTWSSGSTTVTAKHGTKQLGSTTVSVPAVSSTSWVNTTGRTWRADVTIGGVSRSSSTKDFGGYYTDGQAAVTLNNPTWASALPYTSGVTNTATVSTNGRPTQLSKTIPVTISQGSWSSGQKTVDITTTNGSVVARDTVSVTVSQPSASKLSNDDLSIDQNYALVSASAGGASNSRYFYITNGSYNTSGTRKGYMAINIRMDGTSSSNDLVARTWVKAPSPTSFTNVLTSGTGTTAKSYKASAISANKYINFTVGGIAYNIKFTS
jgi:hypothetical protein